MEEFNLNNSIVGNDDISSPAEYFEENQMGENLQNHLEIESSSPQDLDQTCIIHIAEGGANRKASTCEEKVNEKREERDDNISVQTEMRCDEENQISVIEQDDWKYIGEVKNDLRDGFGICYYKDRKYVGQWKNDLKSGYGKIIYDNGNIIQGELIDDNFDGYCERLCLKKDSSMVGHYSHGKFSDIVIVKNEHKIYEGEVLYENPSGEVTCASFSGGVSIGKLSSTKKSDKYFIGEVLNYKDEHGFGLFVKQKSTVYMGEMKNRTFLNYIEMYAMDGASFFAIIKHGLKNGISFSFTKDGRTAYGIFENDYKNGPFIHFSNSNSLSKSSIKMEMYHLGFKSKVTDKMETSKKYLQLNYPEYLNIFDIDYSMIINKFNNVIAEEVPYVMKILKEDESEYSDLQKSAKKV
jgi:hypothetical protein